MGLFVGRAGTSGQREGFMVGSAGQSRSCHEGVTDLDRGPRRRWPGDEQAKSDVGCSFASCRRSTTGCGLFHYRRSRWSDPGTGGGPADAPVLHGAPRLACPAAREADHGRARDAVGVAGRPSGKNMTFHGSRFPTVMVGEAHGGCDAHEQRVNAVLGLPEIAARISRRCASLLFRSIQARTRSTVTSRGETPRRSRAGGATLGPILTFAYLAANEADREPLKLTN